MFRKYLLKIKSDVFNQLFQGGNQLFLLNLKKVTTMLYVLIEYNIC